MVKNKKKTAQNGKNTENSDVFCAVLLLVSELFNRYRVLAYYKKKERVRECLKAILFVQTPQAGL